MQTTLEIQERLESLISQTVKLVQLNYPYHPFIYGRISQGKHADTFTIINQENAIDIRGINAKRVLEIQGETIYYIGG